jgi:hypothetical protein
MARPLAVNTSENPASFTSLPTRIYPRDEELMQRCREINTKYAPLAHKVPGQSHCDSKDGNVVSLAFPGATEHNRMLIIAEITELLFFLDGTSHYSLTSH